MKKIISVCDIIVPYDKDNPKRFNDAVVKQINDIQANGNSAEIQYSVFCDGNNHCHQSAIILEIKEGKIK